MRRGEIWRVRLPAAAGRVQAGDRPALIVQGDSQIALLPTVLVVPFTSTTAAARFPATMTVPVTPTNGLTQVSVALAFQLRAVDKNDCIRRMGAVDAQTLAAIQRLVDDLMK